MSNLLFLQQHKTIQQKRINDQNINRITQLEYREHYYQALKDLERNIGYVGERQRKERSRKMKTQIKEEDEGAQGDGRKIIEIHSVKKIKGNKQQRKMVTLPTEKISKQQKQFDNQYVDEGQGNFKTNRTNKNNKSSQHFQIYQTPYQNLITHSKLNEAQGSLIKQEFPVPKKSFIRTEYTPQTNLKLTTNYQDKTPQIPKHIHRSLLLTSNAKPVLNSKILEIHKQAHKKIKNRVSVSTAIYSQTKFVSKKHENIHLFNTFQVENQIRTQIIAKICMKNKRKIRQKS